MDVKEVVTHAFREGEAFGFDTALGVLRMCLRENIPINSSADAVDILEQYDRTPSKKDPQ